MKEDLLKLYRNDVKRRSSCTLYIAGKMTGVPEWNYPAFNAMAKCLRHLGYTVHNPAEIENGSTDKDRAYYLRQDLALLAECDGIVFLNGWRESPGALMEHHIAQEVGMQCYDQDLRPLEETILEEADRLVNGPRQKAYGHPKEDFARTGRMWGAILGVDDVPPEKVALCMAALKLSREVNSPKRDNRVDACGYMMTADMCMEEDNE